MLPTSFSLGPLTIHLYGFIIGAGILTGAWLAAQKARKLKLDPQPIWDGLIWVIIGGIIGARLYHVVDLYSVYAKNPITIFYVWNGGLGIYGGLIGGVIGAYFYLRRFRRQQKLKTSVLTLLKHYADPVAFAMPVGQAIGRFGNFINQELYGLPSDLPWAISIDPSHRLKGYEQFSHFHPLFAYEAIWSLITFMILLALLRVSKIKTHQGNYFILYLNFYALGRAFLEGFRIDPWTINGYPAATIISFFIVVTSILYFGYKFSKNQPVS